MKETPFARIEALFDRARDLQGDERIRFLERSCAGDPELRAHLEALLHHHDRPHAILTAQLPELVSDEESPAGLRSDLDVRLPEHVGKYRVLGRLGTGGMGNVYRAEDVRTGEQVALKVLRAELATTKFLRRFEREIKVMDRLQHPGIARAHDAGTTDTNHGSLPWFTMDLVDGLPLHQYADENHLDTRKRVELLLKVCEAVGFAHRRGVVHCDLKPRNILVESAPAGALASLGQPKILDFGVARVTADDVHSATMHTGTGHLAGTLPYMSPEQLRSAPAKIDARSDVYALGVLAYQLLGGGLPHDVSELPLLEAARIIHDEDPRPLGDVNVEAAGDLEAVVHKALDTQPGHRYPSVRALAADLQRWLNDEPVQARPPGLVRRLEKYVRRHPTMSATVALGTAALLAVTVLLVQTANAKHEADLRAHEVQVARERAVPLSDSLLLAGLQEEAQELWPAHPKMTGAIDTWLRQARELLGRLPQHRDILARAGATEGTDAAEQQALVDELERFGDPETGLVADVERRREAASTLWQRSVGDFEAEWQAAIRAIAAGDAYGGLELAPQLGLVPLGENPHTGLHEFWHVASGERPEWSPETNELVMRAETGIVLVLLPGGTFWMGAQSVDPDGPNYDVQAQPNEEPHRVTLDPFFLSKYEMTQGQWERVMKGNPSHVGPVFLDREARLHPVEQVSWTASDEALRRLDLRLPTEAQWEFGARGRTQTPWWTGSEARTLRTAANISDRRRGAEDSEDWDDGYFTHAPVGRFRPNPFGLYDVAGNVLEWCLDEYRPYVAFRPGDGLLLDGGRPSSGLSAYCARGGSNYYPSFFARSAIRQAYTPGSAIGALGVRPARRVDE